MSGEPHTGHRPGFWPGSVSLVSTCYKMEQGWTLSDHRHPGVPGPQPGFATWDGSSLRSAFPPEVTRRMKYCGQWWLCQLRGQEVSGEGRGLRKLPRCHHLRGSRRPCLQPKIPASRVPRASCSRVEAMEAGRGSPPQGPPCRLPHHLQDLQPPTPPWDWARSGCGDGCRQ